MNKHHIFLPLLLLISFTAQASLIILTLSLAMSPIALNAMESAEHLLNDELNQVNLNYEIVDELKTSPLNGCQTHHEFSCDPDDSRIKYEPHHIFGGDNRIRKKQFPLSFELFSDPAQAIISIETVTENKATINYSLTHNPYEHSWISSIPFVAAWTTTQRKQTITVPTPSERHAVVFENSNVQYDSYGNNQPLPENYLALLTITILNRQLPY